MKIEAVIVCKDYSDFLEQTLHENIQHLDHVVVVTGHDDGRTRGLCSHYGVDCVPTDVFTQDGDKFNKGRAINLGLGHLKGGEWLLHLDADVALPHRFRDLLKRANLQTNCLYGADRLNVFGFEAWEALRDNRKPAYRDGYFVEAPSDLPVGARIIHKELGFTPIGYFQLWHSSQGKKYPINQGNAEHTDVLFAAQWARQHRVLLPEVYVYHLESERAKMGANWNGRTTKPFAPTGDQQGK